MPFAPLLAAPLLMVLASFVERRLGPAAAGIVAAAPFSIAIIVVALGAEGPAVAASAGAHVVAQVAFALAFAWVIVRRGSLAGFAAGALAFLTISALLAFIPPWFATLLAVPVLLAAKIKVPGTFRNGAPVDAWVGAVIVLGVVATSLRVAAVAGPELAGIVAAFPALSGTFALLLARARGVEAAASALSGLVVGLRGYLAFCVVVATTGAVALGILAAIAMNWALAGRLSAYVTSRDR